MKSIINITPTSTISVQIIVGSATSSGGTGGTVTNLSFQPSSTSGTIINSSGTDAVIPLTTSTNSGLFSPVLLTKLSGIQDQATANSSDQYLLNRSNHFGNQPIDTITGLQAALDSKETPSGAQAKANAAAAASVPLSQKGLANGVATLDGSGKVPSTQLPSYVDDVLEYANLVALPATGENGKIYIALDTGKLYRWSGSVYVEIVGSPGSTDAVPEGSTNLYHTPARVRDSSLTGININDTASIDASSTVLQALGRIWERVKRLGTAAFASTSDFATAAQGTDAREWTAATIDQAEAEAGTATTRRAFTAQRVFQAIAAWWQANSTSAGRAIVTAASAAVQRAALGLDAIYALLTSRVTFSDAAYTITATRSAIVAQTGTLTAARAVTLPAASAFRAGDTLDIVDESGTCSATNALTITRAEFYTSGAYMSNNPMLLNALMSPPLSKSLEEVHDFFRLCGSFAPDGEG